MALDEALLVSSKRFRAAIDRETQCELSTLPSDRGQYSTLDGLLGLVAAMSIWNLSKLDRVIPLAEQLPDALAHCANLGERTDGVRTDVSGEAY